MYDNLGGWDNDNHHPACLGGCGELADECQCYLRQVKTVREHEGYCDMYKDHTGQCYETKEYGSLPCRWSGCNYDAETHGYCDMHYETL